MLLSPGDADVFGNVIRVEKRGRRVALGFHLGDVPDRGPIFTTPKHLHEIIVDWKKIASDPQYNVIVMCIDGKEVQFEGRREEQPFEKFLRNEPVTEL